MLETVYATLPAKFKESDSNTQVEIINIGTSIYYNGLRWVYTESFENKLQESETRLHTVQSLHNDQLQQVKTIYAEKLAQHSHLIEEKYNQSLESKNALLENYCEEIKALKERCKQLEIQNLEALSVGNKIDSLIGKKSTLDNITKGNFGESVVWNQINHYYPHSILEDCSDETAHGDMLWTLNKLKALVEVKNVQNVRPGDVQKFERDLLQNSNNGSVNAGLFVSLKTETIPGKGTLYFEFFNDIPVIYVSNVYESLHNLKIAMEILYNIQSTLCTEVQSNEENHSLQYIQNTVNDFVQMIYNNQKTQLQNIQKMKQTYEALGQTITTEEKSVNENLACINTLKQTISWIVYSDVAPQNQSQKQNRKEEAVQYFIDYYQSHEKWPTAADIPNYKASVYRGEMSLANLKQCAQEKLT